MSRINRVPFGLQDLLGSTNQGDNPNELGEVVAPTLALDTYLSAERRFWHAGTLTTASVDGAVISKDVPVGELWLLQSIGCTVVQNGAGGPYFAQVGATIQQAVNSDNPAVAHPLAHFGNFEGNANATVGSGVTVFTYEFPQPCPLFGDERIFWYINNGDFSGGRSYRIRPSVRYIKLNV